MWSMDSSSVLHIKHLFTRETPSSWRKIFSVIGLLLFWLNFEFGFAESFLDPTPAIFSCSFVTVVKVSPRWFALQDLVPVCLRMISRLKLHLFLRISSNHWICDWVKWVIKHTGCTCSTFTVVWIRFWSRGLPIVRGVFFSFFGLLVLESFISRNWRSTSPFVIPAKCFPFSYPSWWKVLGLRVQLSFLLQNFLPGSFKKFLLFLPSWQTHLEIQSSPKSF